jgi:hypothetical protein
MASRRRLLCPAGALGFRGRGVHETHSQTTRKEKENYTNETIGLLIYLLDTLGLSVCLSLSLCVLHQRPHNEVSSTFITF